MTYTTEERLLLTEKEADLFYASIEPALDYFVKPDFKNFDSFLYVDYMNDLKEPSKVVGFAGETENKEYQIDLHRTQEGYMASFWEEDYLLMDIFLNSKGEITGIVR